jgi:AcrR family transcriptional regulator
MPKIVDAERRRAEITGATARLIARSGIEAVRMRDVAAEAGWTTGAVAHYFTDKRELLLTTFNESLSSRLSLRPQRALASPIEQLWASLEGALPLDADRRRHWMVTIACCSQAVGDAELSRAQRDAYHEFVGHLGGLCVAADLASPEGAGELAAQLIALADGIAIQALFDEAAWPAERQRRMLTVLLGRHGIVR